jgi:ankyrin repeat protein
MKKIKNILTSICLSFFALTLMSCNASSDGNASPEMAKNILKIRDYQFTEKDFFRAINFEDEVATNGFLQAGINPNAKNEKGESALNFAIRYKEPKIAKILIEKADLDFKDDGGNTPLFTALKYEKEDLFNLLLDKGANANSTGTANENTKDQSVLYVTILQAREDLMQKLLEKGADPNLADSRGSLPLSEAVLRRDADPRVVKMLLDKGANPNATEADKTTPLMYIAENNKINPQTRLEIIQMFLDKGADKKLKDEKGKTAVDWAKQGGNKETVEFLQK